MSTLSFTLRDAPTRQVNLSALIPSRLAGLSLGDIEKLSIGSGEGARCVGDVFSVSGSPGETIVISGGSSQFDYVGADLDGGSIIVEGAVGNLAARGMTSGNRLVFSPTMPMEHRPKPSRIASHLASSSASMASIASCSAGRRSACGFL